MQPKTQNSPKSGAKSTIIEKTLMRSIFFRCTINIHKSVRLGFTKIVWEGYWRYALCKYTILELKYYIFQKKLSRCRKTDFRWFFRTQKLKKSIFKGFMKNHDFRPKIMTWGLIFGCKNKFLTNFFLKLFLFVKNLSIGIFTFFLAVFNQNIWIKNVHPFLGFLQFLP